MEPALLPAQRGHWWPKTDFVFSILSLTFNAGFLTSMPFLMLKYGGGLYLIAFALVFVFIAYPLMNMEFSLGQFGSAGSISVWDLCPLFKGIGHGMVLLSMIISIYYSYMGSWPLHYLATTLLSNTSLPWTKCSNHWNTENCTIPPYVLGDSRANLTPIAQPTILVNLTMDHTDYFTQSSANEYFNYRFLAKTNGTGFENLGDFQWEILISFAGFWLLMYLVLMCGHFSLGKVAYITTLFPLGLVIALIVQVVTLPGALDGLLHFLNVSPPDGETILNLCARSHLEIVHSLFLGLGCYSTLASYNRLTYNYHRDSILAVVFTFLFAVLCTFMVAMYTGHYAFAHRIPIQQAGLQSSDYRAIYVMMTSILSRVDYPRLWLCLFFVLIFFLMFGTQMIITETIVTAIADEFFPSRLTKRRRLVFKSLLTLAFCLLMVVVGLPLTSQGGSEIYSLLSDNATTYAPFILILIACLVLFWIYGVVQYSQDANVMLGYKPDYLVLGSIVAVAPLTLLASVTYVSYLSFMSGQAPEIAKRPWYIPVKWTIRILPLILVPVLMVVRLIQAAACPQNCGSHRRFCARVIRATLRWRQQAQRENSERRPSNQGTSPRYRQRPMISSPFYAELKETLA